MKFSMQAVVKKLLQASLIVGFVVNTLSAYNLSKKTPVTIFKGFGKYPYQFKYNPYNSEVDVILYGCLDSKNNVKLITSSKDYKNLAPVQFTMNLQDNGTKIQKNYSGFNETCVMRMADSTLRLFGLLPWEDYKKDFKDDFLMAEINAGNPIKMVFAKKDQFDALKKYLTTKLEPIQTDNDPVNQEIQDATVPVDNIEQMQQSDQIDSLEQALVATEASTDLFDDRSTTKDLPANKPLLLIEIASGEELNQEDIYFLNRHFELADPNDQTVQAFFDKVEKSISKVNPDLHQVAQSAGEQIMSAIDKDFDKGDPKKLTIKATKYIVAGLTIALAAKLTDKLILEPAFNYVKDKISPNPKRGI